MITAIHGGCDWVDASAEYVILPEGMDIVAEKKAYRKWYHEEYCPSFQEGLLKRTKMPLYNSFVQWLLKRGAVEPTEDQLKVVWDD